MKVPPVALWALRIVVAIMFAIPGVTKFLSDPGWMGEFRRLPGGLTSMYLVGGVELICVGLVLYPRTTFLGASVLMAVVLAALGAQIALFGHFPHIVIYGSMVGLLLAVSRNPSASKRG